MGFNKQKLKVNLKLAINRLKLLEKKKTELAQKARKEIADYINNGKDERARIRVEHIIREDYLVEAMEMLELYCDLLLARFGLIETQQYCEEGMIEAVTTLMWSAPRLQTDVQELRVIADQLGLKYGKKFAHEASINANSTVNDRLILKLSPKPPPKSLVENYLIEIARSHNVAFEPDRTVFLEEDDLPEYDEPGPPKGNGFGGSGSGGGGGGTGRIGFEGIAAGYEAPSISNPQYASLNYPPSHGSAPPYPVGPPGNAPPSYPEKVLPPYPGGLVNNHSPTAPPPGPQKPSAPTAPTPAPRSSKGPSFPDLPSVPTDLPNIPDSLPGANSAGGEDVDFDDLTRRFEDLKKKK